MIFEFDVNISLSPQKKKKISGSKVSTWVFFIAIIVVFVSFAFPSTHLLVYIILGLIFLPRDKRSAVKINIIS